MENATYGLTVCAERVAIFKAISEGERNFDAIAVVTDTDALTPPCGACRQLIWEFCGDVPVILSNLKGKTETLQMRNLFPKPFDSSNFLIAQFDVGDLYEASPMLRTEGISVSCYSFLSPRAFSCASAEKANVDMLIAGGTVVTMDAERRIFGKGSRRSRATLSGRRQRPSIEAKVLGEPDIDAKGRLVLPGFINGHTHAPMTLLRGLQDDVTLDDWLKKYIFPAEAKNVTQDFVRWGTRLAAAEKIRSGVTTFVDMYYFEDALAEETKAAGMRAILGESLLDFPAPDNKTERRYANIPRNF